MSKYGRGIRIEFTEAIMNGEIKEPVSSVDLKKFCESKGWNVPNNYTNVYLENASSDTHSFTFVKCFKKIDSDRFVLREDYKRRYGYAI